MFFKSKKQKEEEKKISLTNKFLKIAEKDSIKDFEKLEYTDKYNLRSLYWLYYHNAVNILKSNEKNFNVLTDDEYGYPMWWSAFKRKKGVSDEMIDYLKSKQVDFNAHDNCGYSFSISLAYQLLTDYNYKSLYRLLTRMEIDVNSVHRSDNKTTLLHALSYLTPSRYSAFKKDNDYVERCVNIIQEKGNYKTTDKQGRNYIDLCLNVSHFSPATWQVEKLARKELKIKLTDYQKASYLYLKNKVNNLDDALSAKKNLQPFLFVEKQFDKNNVLIVGEKVSMKDGENKISIQELSQYYLDKRLFSSRVYVK